jgi:hypothetical protein
VRALQIAGVGALLPDDAAGDYASVAKCADQPKGAAIERPCVGGPPSATREEATAEQGRRRRPANARSEAGFGARGHGAAAGRRVAPARAAATSRRQLIADEEDLGVVRVRLALAAARRERDREKHELHKQAAGAAAAMARPGRPAVACGEESSHKGWSAHATRSDDSSCALKSAAGSNRVDDPDPAASARTAPGHEKSPELVLGGSGRRWRSAVGSPSPGAGAASTSTGIAAADEPKARPGDRGYWQGKAAEAGVNLRALLGTRRPCAVWEDLPGIPASFISSTAGVEYPSTPPPLRPGASAAHTDEKHAGNVGQASLALADVLEASGGLHAITPDDTWSQRLCVRVCLCVRVWECARLCVH